jgi:uncharacterized membrane protein (UPF0127 family)
MNYPSQRVRFLALLSLTTVLSIACRNAETLSDLPVSILPSVSVSALIESPALSSPPNPLIPSESRQSIQAGTCLLNLAIARTPAEHAQGLMNRPMLGQKDGMLFVHENETPLKFWMLDTLIPLDILFLDSKGRVVDIQTMEPQPGINPESLKIYTSGAPARFGLEVNSGIAAACGLKIGSLIDLSPI